MNILERLNLKLQIVQNMYETVTRVPIISSFFDKMKEVKKYGEKQNIANTNIPILNSIMLLFLISAKLTVVTFHVMQFVEDSGTIIPNYIYEVSAYGQIILWGVLVITVLPLTSKMMCKIENIGQTLLFSAINKVDLFLWRRYKKESLIAQSIWKLQYKMQKQSIQNKRKLFLVVLAGFAIYSLHRLGYL